MAQPHRGEYRVVMKHLGSDGKDIRLQRFEMEEFAWRFYSEATFDGPDPMPWFDAAIRRVVWGGLYIEAVINLLCRQLMWTIVRPEHDSQELWEMIERSKTVEKAEMLATYNGKKDDAKAICGMTQRISEIRNRLVHFKEDPVEQPLILEQGSFTIHGIMRMEIEKALSRDSLKKFDDDMTNLRRWLLSLPQAAPLKLQPPAEA